MSEQDSTPRAIPADGVRDLLNALIDALWIPRPADHDDNSVFLDAQRDRATAVAASIRNIGEPVTATGVRVAAAELRAVAAETLPYAVREES